MTQPLSRLDKTGRERYQPYVAGGGQLGGNSSNSGVPTTLTLTAGAGLTGGGDLSADRTFAVGAGNGITVNADDVAVNQGFAFTWTAVHTFSPTARSSGVAPYFKITTPADTGITINTEGPGIVFGGDSSHATVTRTLADGTTIATFREYIFVAPTYAAAGATTLTTAATLAITGPPVAGSAVTITNALGLGVVGKTVIGQSITPQLVPISGVTQTFWTEFNSTDSGAGGVSDAIRIGTHVNQASIIFNVNIGNLSHKALLWVNDSFTFVVGSISSMPVEFRTNNAQIGIISTGGLWSIGAVHAAGATADIRSQGTTTIALRVDSKANSTVDTAVFNSNITNTATIGNTITFACNSNGTAAAGFGQSHTWTLETSTTNDTLAAVDSVSWVVATHASRTARRVFSVYDTAIRECLRLEASGSAAMIGFLGANAVARTSAYTPTNVTTDRSYDADTVLVAELADVVGTLIADLQAFGLLG